MGTGGVSPAHAGIDLTILVCRSGMAYSRKMELALVILILYFVPFMVADLRGTDRLVVFLINLLFGWTVIGWGVALWLALTWPRLTPLSR
jgi:hypothetical protein